MNWTDKTKFQLTIEKGSLKIKASESGVENFLKNKLIYVPLDEDERQNKFLSPILTGRNLFPLR